MTAKPPPSGPVAAALPIIEKWARTGRLFSGNDLRPEMDAAAIPEHRRGPALAWARAHGIVRHVGYQPSTGRSAHGAVLSIWQGELA